MSRLHVVTLLEAGARAARALGGDRVIDRLRGPVLRRVGRFTHDVDGIRLTGLAAMHTGYVRELAQGRRERYLTDLFVEAVRPGMTVADVGAYLGYLTILAARAVERQGRVVAFEPDARTFRFLTENVRANGVAETVTAVQQAVGRSRGATTFYLSAAGDTSSRYAQAAADEATQVEMTTLDDFFGAEPPVDVVKIDVEGAELDVLDGMTTTVERAANMTLFVECNPDALAVAGRSPAELLGRLDELGFDVRAIDERHRSLGPVDAARIEGYVNLYCVRGGRGP